MSKAYIDINSKGSKNKFYQLLNKQIREIDKTYDEICVACIGTDRATGDCLGPLVGHKLSRGKGYKVVGTLQEPLTASKVNDFAKSISDNTLVIAVDASLGEVERVNHVAVEKGAICPGSGIGKELLPIGDIAITGIVNIGGLMEIRMLQSTRLSRVMQMADIISYGLKKSLKELQV